MCIRDRFGVVCGQAAAERRANVMAAFAACFFWGGTKDEPVRACGRELLVAGDGCGTDQWSEVGFRQKRIARLKFTDRRDEQFLEFRRDASIDENATGRVATLPTSQARALGDRLS